MISVDQRVVILIFGYLLILVVSLHDLMKYSNPLNRYERFVFLLGILFPIIDLTALIEGFKFLEFAILLFTLINLKTIGLGIIAQKPDKLLLFLGFLIVAAFFSEFYENSLLAIFRLLLYYILFYIFKQLFLYEWKNASKLFTLIMSIGFLFFVGQLLFGIDFSLYHSLNEVALRDLRYTSFSQDPQKAATIFYIIAILFLGWANQNQLLKKRYYLFFGISLLMGVFTGSRSALLGFFVALILLFLGKLNVKKFAIGIAIAIACFLLMDEILSLPVFQRFDNFEESLDGRLTVFWLNALVIFYENIWLGVGHGNFGSYVAEHMKNFTYGTEGILVDQPESGFLLWLSETGIIGVAFYLFFIIKTLIKKVSSEFRPFKLAFLVWLVGFSTVYSLSDTKIVFVVLILLAGIYHSQRVPQYDE